MKASNQVAELFAVLALLRAVPREYDVLVVTDSQFTVNVMTKWMLGWKRNGWRKADGSPVANLDLIQDLDRAMSGRVVKFQWVKGHAGHPMNEVADRICSDASGKIARGQKVMSGPGWTGYHESPVIPAVGPRRPTKSTPASKPKGAARLVGERITAQDLREQGWGANAKVVRVSAAAPSSPTPPKMQACGSCDGPINPLTLHCRCGSL